MTAALEGGECSASRPGRTSPPGKGRVPILQEAGWAPGPVWTGSKSLPLRDSIPDRPGTLERGGGISRERSFQYHTGIWLECLKKTRKCAMRNNRKPGPSFEPGTNRIQSRNIDSSTPTFYLFWKSLFPSGCLLMDTLHGLRIVLSRINPQNND